MAKRTTRSRSREEDIKSASEPYTAAHHPLPSPTSVVLLPDPLRRASTGLQAEEFRLLQLKQRKLGDPLGQIPMFVQDQLSKAATRNQTANPSHAAPLVQAATSTLVFAQQEAGTAVCISRDGLLLTCSHCIAELQQDLGDGRETWLLFASGQAVRARCVVWDYRRDLALLQITAAQASPSLGRDAVASTSGARHEFPFVAIADCEPKRNTPLICIGHPGSEDLEAATRGIPTDYDVLHVSYGRYRGLAAEQDPHDNSEIGALMHDCWTYWGHSGSPLVEQKSGKLVGLHSSWDDQTAMRRGVPLVAIAEFLKEHVETQIA